MGLGRLAVKALESARVSQRDFSATDSVTLPGFMPTRRTIFSLCALLGVACAGPRGPEAGPSDREPAVLDESFAFLLERYDRDGDGVVTADEYDREGGSFSRLDRVVDGVLTAADFAPAGRRVRGLGFAEANRLRSLHLLAWYFQTEEGSPLELDEAELCTAFDEYDANGDGRVGRTEFERIAPTRRAFGVEPAGRLAGLLEVETTDPWERLLLGIDQSDDGFMTPVELARFFRVNADDGTWSFDESASAVRRGALTGQTAPDFTLATDAGGQRVTLSEFAGDRPVALIFGSYT